MRATRITRRTLVGGAGTVLAGAALTTPAHARLLTGARGIGPGEFLDGVASGEPAPDAVTFWGRVTTPRPRTAARLIVAEDEGLGRVVATTVVPTSSGVDHTLKARVGGLRPDTHYWYVWQSATGMSPVGRTKTAPDPASAKAIAIGFSSCQRLTHGFFNAHADAAARDDLDLYAFLGDYTYEYAAAKESGGAADELATNDLASYRAKLRFYRADPYLRELHRVHPTVHTWDDHEVEDNYTDGRNGHPFASQRAAGYRASFEWHPRLSVPGDRYRLYRNWRLGRHAELLMLDQRQYRRADQPEAFLGRAQMEWAKASLSGSGASWKLLGNPTMITMLGPNGPLGGTSFNTDQWDGYTAERDELLGHIGAGGLQDVVFLTGDIHIFFANHLPVDSRPGSGSPIVATEYVGGSVTSAGVPEWLEWLGNGAIKTINPQFQYVQGARHGWAVLRADANELRVDYRASDITRQGAPSETIASFVQARGANRLEQTAGTRGGDAKVTRAGEAGARSQVGDALTRRRDAEARIALSGRAQPRLVEQAARRRTHHDDRSPSRRRAA
ncbi:alkaline phosphatase D family protein [Patulibacter sp. SYSU D01012]|uniref:alkaline phosphatase D family protein n=1 Tax=Patulibacter sp. SYSU D01012 TaxID=2817381 RepID=UPI001B30C111|nr:alkaline phosphatase D family protein [Patulibacter sp. SYSU D01012]